MSAEREDHSDVRPATAGVPPGTGSGGEIRTFTAADGRALRYRQVSGPALRRPVVCLHGIESHGGWFLPAAERLAERGFTLHLVDRRGSGLNSDIGRGDAASASEWLDDLARFRQAAGIDSCHLVGLSFGGKLATALALDQPEWIKSLALVTPGLVPRVTLSPGAKLAYLAGCLTGGRNRIKVPITPEMFTATPRFLEFIRNDPLRTAQVTVRFLRASMALGARIERGLARLAVPVLLVLAEGDVIIDGAGTRRLLAGAARARVSALEYEGATHAVQFDQVDRLAADLSRFFDEVDA